MPETIEETLSRLRRDMWKPIRDEHHAVHRGFGAELSDEDHAIVHDKTRPLHERASRLMDHLAQSPHGGSGLGIHWTTDANVAHHFAKIDASHRQKYDEDADGEKYGHDTDGIPRMRPETRVVLHAHFPEHEHIAHEEEDQDGAFGWDVRNQLHHNENGGGIPGGYEREVPIKRGKPVKVHAISWGLASHRSESPVDHDRETTRYDFPETLHHKALRTSASFHRWLPDGSDALAVRPGRPCEGCGGTGYVGPGEGCGACDESGRDPECPCGLPVTKQPGEDWWSHLDGSVSHDHGPGVAELMHRVGMRYIRNPESSTAHGDFGEQYGQHIEPAGRYLNEQSGDHVPEGWESGEVHFRNPLHLPFGGSYRETSNWKHQLHQRYDGATGHELSQAIVNDGHDGIVTHDEYGTSEIVDLTHLRPHRTGKRWLPTRRLFGPTYGLDKRLFDGQHLRPDVARFVLATLGNFWTPRYGPGWRAWARVYLAGSEASEWTSETLEGNNDFDVLIGVDYARCRESVTALAQLSDVAITDRMNSELRADLIPRTDPTWITIGGRETGPWSNTYYVNADSYDIRVIKPYAAYDITRDSWAVKPPHLPNWSIQDFPQGHALVQECWGYEDVVRAILRQPEPYRSQQGDALWRHLHSDRSRAFGPQGEGWYDAGNVIEKFLDQRGLWEPLARTHFDAVADPSRLLAPAGWSNDPR